MIKSYLIEYTRTDNRTGMLTFTEIEVLEFPFDKPVKECFNETKVILSDRYEGYDVYLIRFEMIS